MSFIAFIYHPRWEGKGIHATIAWDVSGYYMYLPATFIYEDIKGCTFKDSILKTYAPTPNFQQAFIHKKSGNYVMKYAMGQAVVMSPFFLIGHTWAMNSPQYVADGFTYPYQVSIGIGMFLIALLGIFFLRKVLLEYFRDSTVAIVLLLYVFGSNYLMYSCVDQAMTHNGLFTIYALLVWITIQFYKTKKVTQALGIGFLTGLATLIRPTEIIAIFIPILWGVSNIQTLKARLLFFKTHYTKLALAAFVCCIIIFCQPLYWHYVTGDWVVYSYEDQGFSWLAPHVWDFCMSYGGGWLRYAPIMFFALLGLLFYIKKKENRFAIILFSLCAFYITTAWDVWDYGDTSGRAMIQYYVILAFSFATLIEYVNSKKNLKYTFYPIAILFTYLNIWAFRAGDGNIQISRATRQYYWSVVGRWSAEQETRKLLDNKHLFRGQPKKSRLIYANDLSTDSLDYTFINAAIQHSPKYYFPRPQQDFKWLRATTNFHCILKEWDLWKQCQFVLTFFYKDKEVQTNLIRVHRFIDNNETKDIYLDAKTPTQWDRVEISYFNAGGQQEMRMSNLNVIGFNQ